MYVLFTAVAAEPRIVPDASRIMNSLKTFTFQNYIVMLPFAGHALMTHTEQGIEAPLLLEHIVDSVYLSPCAKHLQVFIFVE